MKKKQIKSSKVFFRKQTVENYARDLAGDNPYPGGGSASCLVGSLGIALAEMVAGVLLKKNPDPALKEIKRALGKLRSKALLGIDGDVAVYKKVVAAYALSKERAGRAEKIEQALQQAYTYQRDFALSLFAAGKLQSDLRKYVKGSIASDLVFSGKLLEAAFYGAYHTAKINADYFKDATRKAEAEKTLAQLALNFGMKQETGS